MEKNCPYCKDVFKVKRTDSVYCSRSCRQLAYMERKIEKLKQVKTQVIPIGENLPGLVANSEAAKIYGYLPVETAKQEIAILPNKKEEVYIPPTSAFVDAIRERIDNLSNQEALHNCISLHLDVSCYWIGQRLRCLLECLLALSETKYAKVADLMEICNAFTYIMRSIHYESLPEVFPYRDDIGGLRDKLKRVCVKAQKADEIKFRLEREDKIQLITTRYELAQYISKKKFSQLDFG